ncbi:MAG: hypothetical protein H7256_15840 [Bdellovibrio sp.]|nr:hypothetical protein [Bdellovibrio sp.]
MGKIKFSGVNNQIETKILEKRFDKVAAILKAKPWFSKEEWIVSHHSFPKTKPDGVTLHVYKCNWYNEDRLGIHFESFLDLNPKKQKKAYLTLHTFHYDQIPGKLIERKKFAKPLVDSIYKQVSAWDGDSFRAGKYGTQSFTTILDACSSQFENQLVKQLERLCKRVGPEIEKTLNSLMD